MNMGTVFNKRGIAASAATANARDGRRTAVPGVHLAEAPTRITDPVTDPDRRRVDQIVEVSITKR